MHLRKERKAAKLTQAELASRADVPQSSISKIERGTLLCPTFDTLDKLAKALRRAGRKVEARQLQPRKRPVLVKGLTVERHADSVAQALR